MIVLRLLIVSIVFLCSLPFALLIFFWKCGVAIADEMEDLLSQLNS